MDHPPNADDDQAVPVDQEVNNVQNAYPVVANNLENVAQAVPADNPPSLSQSSSGPLFLPPYYHGPQQQQHWFGFSNFINKLYETVLVNIGGEMPERTDGKRYRKIVLLLGFIYTIFKIIGMYNDIACAVKIDRKRVFLVFGAECHVIDCIVVVYTLIINIFGMFAAFRRWPTIIFWTYSVFILPSAVYYVLLSLFYLIGGIMFLIGRGVFEFIDWHIIEPDLVVGVWISFGIAVGNVIVDVVLISLANGLVITIWNENGFVNGQ